MMVTCKYGIIVNVISMSKTLIDYLPELIQNFLVVFVFSHLIKYETSRRGSVDNQPPSTS